MKKTTSFMLPEKISESMTTPPLFADASHFRFCLKERIGGGSFGEVYKASSPCFKEEFAIKTESADTETPQLSDEYKLYRHLDGGPGIPKIRWFGTEGNFRFMAMELLGPSLETIMSDKRYSVFSLKTTIMLADQLIRRLEYLHNKDYVYRDCKPDNFLMGLGSKKGVVHIIDLGMCKRFKNEITRKHISFRTGKGMTGTARYASVNSHLGCELSRRDDLESLGYILVFFLTGKLPWQGLKFSNKYRKYEEIGNLKSTISSETLCEKCPPEFATFLDYTKTLHFDQRPDYFYLRRLLRSLFLKSEFTLDLIFDWTKSDDDDDSSTSEPEPASASDSSPSSSAILRRYGCSVASLPRKKHSTPQAVLERMQLIIPPFRGEKKPA